MLTSCLGQFDIIPCLLEQTGIEVNQRDSYGSTALYLATIKGFGTFVDCVGSVGEAG